MELWFLFSGHCLIVLYISTKFQEKYLKGSVPTHFFICGFLYPLSIKSAGMKLNFEGTR